MNARQRRTIEALRRIQGFLGRTLGADDAPAVAATRDELATLVARATAQLTEQDLRANGSRAEHQRRRALARALRLEHMRPLVAVARVALATTPGALAELRMPIRVRSVEQLLVHAASMASAAGPRAERLVAAGLPADFVARLGAAIEEVRGAVAGGAAHRARRVAATAAVESDLRQARKLVAVLDAFLVPQLERTPALLAEWKVVKRVVGMASVPAVVEEPAPAVAEEVKQAA